MSGTPSQPPGFASTRATSGMSEERGTMSDEAPQRRPGARGPARRTTRRPTDTTAINEGAPTITTAQTGDERPTGPRRRRPPRPGGPKGRNGPGGPDRRAVGAAAPAPQTPQGPPQPRPNGRQG